MKRLPFAAALALLIIMPIMTSADSKVSTRPTIASLKSDGLKIVKKDGGAKNAARRCAISGFKTRRANC